MAATPGPVSAGTMLLAFIDRGVQVCAPAPGSGDAVCACAKDAVEAIPSRAQTNSVEERIVTSCPPDKP